MTGPWWREAVFYQVYVRSFADADGDGLGDLPGITSRLPYLRDLGVDALWLTPFYPSPQHDAGYDVADYVDVDPRFGSLADADELFATAHRLGLKVIVDLVPNHTSSDHAWFRAALASEPGSPERARYLFRPGRGRGGAQPPNNWVSVFGGPAWTRVPPTDSAPHGEWYLHLFDSTQPDLNWRNPDVPAMFEGVLRFWLDRGVDGFRIDVAHSLFKVASLRDQRRALAPSEGPQPPPTGAVVQPLLLDQPMWDQPEVHGVYRTWRRILEEYDGDRMLVAEAWTEAPESLARYVRPDELHQAFNFAWLLAPWSASAFADVITSTRSALAPVGASATWVLSNHDVRRHATRYGGGPTGLARARAATLTMLALPGSSYVYQGEELGLEEVDVPPGGATGPCVVPDRQPRARRRPRADAVARHATAVRLQPGGHADVAPDARRVGRPHRRQAAQGPLVDVVVLPRRAAGAPQVRRRGRRHRAGAHPLHRAGAAPRPTHGGLQLRLPPGPASGGRGRDRQRSVGRRPPPPEHRRLADLTAG